MRTLLSILLLSIVSSACTSIIRTNQGSESVRLFFVDLTIDDSLQTVFDKSCTFNGELIASEGRWYTYLFISNELLIQGALNDLKNKSYQIGADTVAVHLNIDFKTSATFVGQAYTCNAITAPK